ncbi:MAG: hypothetical protein VX969_02280 [Verrucomicrobiota bacterium]|nr:hypothetical protein [Verrucomicrobiota bacterium]
MDSKLDGKASSLKWAIGELSKQREELEGKLKVARKRDETSALIDEVHAQKEALEKRISSLQEGLSVSSELVEDEVDSLEETISAVDEKLGLAQERLEALEQEEYLEELGRKLNGDQYSETDFEEPSSEDELPDMALEDSSSLPQGESSLLSDTDPQLHASVESSPTPVLMKSPSNRMETDQEEEISVASVATGEVSQSRLPEGNSLELCSDVTAASLEECAEALGLEPEYLLNKGMQAVLRMIARNGNKISFPLEVDQLK